MINIFYESQICENFSVNQIYHINFDIEDSNTYKFIEDLRNAINNIDKLDEKLFKNKCYKP